MARVKEGGQLMRVAFCEDGSIIYTTAGKAAFRRQVITMRSCPLLNGSRPRVWFRDCPEWRAASDGEMERFRKISRGGM